MNCNEGWSFEHYQPYYLNEYKILVDRRVPKETSFSLAWCGGKDIWNVYYRLKDSEDEWTKLSVNTPYIEITGFEEYVDFEFYVESGEDKSMLGYIRTGYVPGTIVNYLHPNDMTYSFSGRFLCSPSILVHPDGYYLVSMDVFGRKTPQNLTMIFRSDDKGETWYHYTDLFPCFWGTLFLHRGEVYMLATSTEYGDLLIGKSIDGGKTWGTPTVLFRGACHGDWAGAHKSAVPVVEYDGRLWCNIDYGGRVINGYYTCMISADVNGDLLDASNWVFTEPLKYNPNWEGAVKGDDRGFMEGNAVVVDGVGICDILRYSTEFGEPKFGLAGVLKADSKDPEKSLDIYKFAKFPGNMSKFYVQRDPKTGLYFALLSRITEDGWVRMRNILSLAYAEDIGEWHVLCDVVNCEDEDPKKIGFQYPSFCIDGDDIICVSRTAYNGAANMHDNNYVTFHRIKNFRDMISK